MYRRRFTGASYSIAVTLHNAVGTNSKDTIDAGRRYVNEIAPNTGEDVIVPTITMKGVDITSTAWDSQTNTITIPHVTGDLVISVICTKVITFAATYTKGICVNKWGNFVEGELTEYEASRVTSLGTTFKSDTSLVYFNELEYFTGLTTLSDAFNGCTALKQIKLPHTTYSGNFSMYRAFYNCSAITGTLDCSPIKANTVTSISECFYSCHASNLIVPTTNRINQSIGWCFRGIRSVTLDLTPLADSHLTIPDYCFYGWQGVTTFITTGVYINGASDNVVLWHNANPCPVTTFIGGFLGWNKDLNLTYMPNIGRDGAMEIINSISTVTSKTLTFALTVYNTLTSDEAAIAANKGWVGAGLWQKNKINGVKIPFGLFSVTSTLASFNIASNLSVQVISDGVDVTSTAVVNGKVTVPDNKAENEFNFTTNSNSGTITFSGTTDTGSANSSRYFFSASQNGWYKVTLNIDANTTVLGTSAKGAALIIRRYCPYVTRYNGSVDYDYWEFVNVESFVADATIEAYGYMGIGDVLTTFDTLDGSCTFTVELVEAITIPTGYAISLAMQSGLDIIQVTPGIRLDHSVETKFKINDFSQSQYWIGMYQSGLRCYNLGRTGGTGYALYTYWGKNVAYPTTSVLVSSDMINNILYFKADKTQYLVKRINNGTQYGDSYTAKSLSEATSEYFYIRKCECFWLKLWDGATLVRNIIPLVDKNARNVFKLYDLVEEEFITE